MTIAFDHVHAAHCESGVVAAMLRHGGLKLSEAMVFGIGSGLFFLYLPLFKIYGAPLTAYRDAPNAIMTRCAKRLGVGLRKTRFRDPQVAMQALDDALARGVPVGMQTGVFWLPYFPRDMRFQFNGHHVIAYGKEHDDYLLSDTVFEQVVRCASADLQRARFAKGPLAPKGLLYYLDEINTKPDLVAAVRTGIRMTTSRMLGIPISYMGVKGIRTLSRALAGWPQKLGDNKAKSWLANVIRMQEEIGTGGAGFRFMYAAFLDEAAQLLDNSALHQVSQQLSEIGDRWRDFAVAGAQVIRDQKASAAGYQALADIIAECADREQRAFAELRRAV